MAAIVHTYTTVEGHTRTWSKTGIWTGGRYQGELVAVDGDYSLWSVGDRYFHVVGDLDDFIGGFGSDEEAVAYWRGLVRLTREARGRR